MVRALTPVCKAEGIRRIRVGELELEFGGSGVTAQDVAAFTQAFDGAEPTDEDVLNWNDGSYVPSWERKPATPAPKTARGRRPA